MQHNVHVAPWSMKFIRHFTNSKIIQYGEHKKAFRGTYARKKKCSCGVYLYHCTLKYIFFSVMNYVSLKKKKKPCFADTLGKKIPT